MNFTAIDNAGNSSQGSFTVTVNQTGFVGSVLYVIGTSGNDAFVINGTNPSSVPITIGGTAVYGSPFNLSRGQTINVYGNAGNDTFTISGAVGATLDGGTGSNTFTVTSYTGTGTLTGGGSDTVVATKNVAAINLSNTAFSTPADGMSLTISGMGTANITGGAANNTYNVSGWTGAGNFAAGGGTDTLNYTNDVSGIVLTNTSVAISGGASVTLSGFEVANLPGRSSNNTFDVSGWTGTGSLTGNGATSTVAATKNTDTTLTNSSLTAGTMNMMLSGITLTRVDGEQHRISRDRRIGLQRQLDPDRRRNGPCQALRWLGERHPESHRKRPSRPGGRRRRRHVERGRQRSDDPHRRLGRRQRDQYRRRSGNPDWGQHDLRCTHRRSPDSTGRHSQ